MDGRYEESRIARVTARAQDPCRLMALRDISRRRSNSVALGAKRTSIIEYAQFIPRGETRSSHLRLTTFEVAGPSTRSDDQSRDGRHDPLVLVRVP